MSDNIPAYKILALGPFAPVPDGKFKPGFVKLDLYSIDEAVKTIAPVLYVPIPLELCSEGALTLKFDNIKDFKPEAIKKNNSFFKTLPTGKPKNLKTDNKNDTAIDNILSMVDTSDMSSGHQDEPAGSVGNDKTLMQEIFSNSKFKKTESAWRGIQTLVKQAKIKGFNKLSVSISSISDNSLKQMLDVIKALPQDEIPNLILIDLEFDNTLPCIERLENVIGFADEMMIPVCVSISPGFFRLDDFIQLDKLQYLKNHLEDVSYVKFKKLQKLAGASWVIATCNDFAVRDANEFETQPLGASPVWAFGALCAKAVNDTGWPMKFTRYDKYYLENLPMFNQDQKDTSSAAALFSDERIIQLAETGITAVVGPRAKDFIIIPKESALSCDSIKFQMFFNRIIESIINIKEKKKNSGLSPEDCIKEALTDIFTKTGHDRPKNILIKKSDNFQEQNSFFISFVPPGSVFLGLNVIEFSFIW